MRFQCRIRSFVCVLVHVPRAIRLQSTTGAVVWSCRASPGTSRRLTGTRVVASSTSPNKSSGICSVWTATGFSASRRPTADNECRTDQSPRTGSANRRMENLNMAPKWTRNAQVARHFTTTIHTLLCLFVVVMLHFKFRVLSIGRSLLHVYCVVIDRDDINVRLSQAHFLQRPEWRFSCCAWQPCMHNCTCGERHFFYAVGGQCLFACD
jgi:hypothetical protein